MRTCAVVIAVIVTAALWSAASTAVVAQSCNASPDRPTALTAARASDNQVLVTWTVASSDCPATRYYVEATRGAEQAIEANTTSSSATLPVPRNANALWRIAVRAFNQYGVSDQRMIAFDERDTAIPNVPAPNTCMGGAVLPPTLVSVNAVGRTMTVQWTPDPRCLVTGYTIVGRYTADGPIIGTVAVPYPNVQSWSGSVPPGSYYVSVYSQYYGRNSVPSAPLLVHVQ